MHITKDHETAVARLMREVAEREIMGPFRDLASLQVDQKSSASDLVTPADTATEVALIAGLREIFPEANIWGEESFAANPSVRESLGSAEISIVIDPIDGTWNFAHGIAAFASMLSIHHQGEVIYGAILDPVSGDLITAVAGQGAWLETGQGACQRLRIAPPAADAPLNLLVPTDALRPGMAEDLAKVHDRFNRISAVGASGQDFRMLALGRYHALVSHRLTPWDHAGGALIYAEAGGHGCLSDGRPYSPMVTDGRFLQAASPAVLDILLQAFGD